MTVTYQVGGGGHLDIDFWVCCKDDTGLVSFVYAHHSSQTQTAMFSENKFDNPPGLYQ